MSACSRKVFPPVVVESVKQTMQGASVEKEIPESMVLRPSMKRADVKDALVSKGCFIASGERSVS